MSRSRILVTIVAFSALTLPLGAQGLRDKLADLFKFGSADVQLFLVGSGDPNNPAAIQAHGRHFIPSGVANNASLISFVTNAIGGSAQNTPITAAGGGTTFRIENGVPVATSISPGPLFAERALTLGKGRTSVGLSRSSSHFKSIRGVGLDDIRLIFTHQNVTDSIDPGCSARNNGNCGLYGVPLLENDIIRVNLGLDLNVNVTTFTVAYGLFDRVDFSVALPIVETSLRGTSSAHIDPFGFAGNSVGHFFGGTSSNPVLDATSSIFGSASGIGDFAVRLKFNVAQLPRSGFAFLVDARIPSGNADDLLGTGHLSVRGLAIASARLGAFSPHVNLGYLVRTGDLSSNAMLVTAGFDHMMAPFATVAVDVVSELQDGDSKVRLPGTVTYDSPFRRTLPTSSIPNIRDDLVNASFGIKLRAAEDLLTVMNALLPLNRAGLRPNLTWTVGLEYNF